MEGAKTLCGDQRAFAQEPFELAGVALVQWVAVDNLGMQFVQLTYIVQSVLTNLLIVLVQFKRVLKGFPKRVIVILSRYQPGSEDMGRLIPADLPPQETQPGVDASTSILLSRTSSCCHLIYPSRCGLLCKFPRPPLCLGLAQLWLAGVCA